MKRYLLSILLTSIGWLFTQESIKMELSEHLEPFEPYIGKTFKGEFADSTPEKPIFDVSHWERTLNGQAI